MLHRNWRFAQNAKTARTKPAARGQSAKEKPSGPTMFASSLFLSVDLNEMFLPRK